MSTHRIIIAAVSYFVVVVASMYVTNGRISLFVGNIEIMTHILFEFLQADRPLITITPAKKKVLM